jgi:hypothetical protein
VGGVRFVKIIWGVGGWCVVCIGKGVENRVVMVCERENGQCELWGSMIHDELGDMGHFVPMKKVN